MTGPIQVKRSEVAADIRMLAALTGVSITDAIANAVRAQLAIERVKGDSRLRARRKAVKKTLAELRRLPIAGSKLEDKDLYDEAGLPEMSASERAPEAEVVADASAVLAVLFNEEDADRYLSRLLVAGRIWMSPVNWWETQVRMRSVYGDAGENVTKRWIAEMGIVIEPVTEKQAETALAAYSLYGGRPARLNMGACFAYALAKTKGIPLVYKGGDFAKTDLKSA